jgi:Helix-turn-helix domain
MRRYAQGTRQPIQICAAVRGELKWSMAKIRRSYRIRIYPNGAQRRLRDRWFGAYRWLWNTALEIRTEAYLRCDLSLTGNDKR